MGFPFLARLLLLLGVAGALSWIDFRRSGPKATAAREYSFVFLTGALGAVVGALNDSITSAISPDYFILGKGLSEGDGLRLRSVVYGLQVGCSGGVVVGAIVVYMARRKSTAPPVSFRWLLHRVWIPIFGAAVGALIAPRIAGPLDPFNLRAQLQSLLAPARMSRFLFVWWVQTGLYAGLLVGVVLFVYRIVRRRRLLQLSEAATKA